MKKATIYLYFILYILTLVGTITLYRIIIPRPVQARTNAIAALHTSAQGQITIIVLDMSASMKTNDPGGLRCSAANAYIDLSGPSDLIGVIGLDNNNNVRSGPHNFQGSFVWAQPTQMDTMRERQGLQQTIAEKSHKCQYDGTTPTYDALNQALAMLNSKTQRGQLSGSVILLTDGEPAPDTSEQMEAIKSDLLPQFKNHNWTIDTIALGTDTGFYNFLSVLANTTSGKFYEDNNRVVPGVSPLNIASFFIDIFARHNGRILRSDLAPISLNGAPYSYNFTVGDYVDHLDIVAVKERPVTVVTLTAPNGQTLHPGVAGAFISTHDPHYAIFSIPGPDVGDWQLDVHGMGQFLVNSLILSSLKVSIISPTQDIPVLPIGKKFTISAYITHEGSLIGGLTVTASVTYVGSPVATTDLFPWNVELSDNASSGIYEGQVTVPQSAPAGSYEIVVSASGVTNSIIASDHRTIRLELFPSPFFLTARMSLSTANTVSYTINQWDPVLQFIGFSHWPLQSLLTQPPVNLPGEVILRGKPYPNATVKVFVTSKGTNSIVPVKVVNDHNGYFYILFLSQVSDGAYCVNFSISGTFEDSHGDFGTTIRTIRLVKSVPLWLDVLAWLLILMDLMCPVLFFLLLRFLRMPRPFGECVESEYGDIVARYAFNQSGPNPLKWFFWFHTLNSEWVYSQKTKSKMPGGLKFRFRNRHIFPRTHTIEVRPVGKTGTYWKSGDGKELHPKKFQKVHELVFQSTGEDGNSDSSTFTIISP